VKRWLPPILLAIAVIVVGAVVVSSGGNDELPRVTYREGTPGDVMALGDSSFADVLAAFPARVGCLRDVTVAHNWDLGTEAGFYEANYIEIEVPNTSAQIRQTYVHEFGHHLDFNCVDRELRDAFIAAMGHGPSTDWYSESWSWERRPAEQFAEAVVAVVGGSPLHADMQLTSDAVRVVEDWARR